MDPAGKKVKLFTLCIIHNGSRILLGMKKRGFGMGYWNGFGGKVEEGESIEDCLKREIREELGVVLCGFKKKGVLEFEFREKKEILQVHLFSASNFEGKIKETEEMRPKWFNINEIPYQSMWPDDKYWLPLLLKGKRFSGRFYFKDNKTLLGYKIREI